MLVRCGWVTADPLYIAYHDEEWGVPAHDDRHLFEMLILEGAQAGLSWITVLRKREAYRRAFAGFDPAVVARFRPARVARLLEDPGIVRNRLKVASAVTNARCFLEVQREHGSFDGYLWSFVGGRPLVNAFRSMAEVPARTALSDALSKDLARRGFKFVGSTICYALMQAVGMVNDHLVSCFRYPALAGAAPPPAAPSPSPPPVTPKGGAREPRGRARRPRA
ncbi:DNA-3-methyladenine glycosylase I [Sorangium sp. So ce1036]|uniref:DNA-3-methyladenine glycosylase I n=1 Tax=Sorangium sp. So ce1036 TaxID=3133328 RepID=UPI003EFEBC7C